jgi:hypothetical protein
VTNPPHRPSRQIPARPAPPARPSGAHGAFGAEELEKQAAIRDVMEYAVNVTRATQLAKQIESYRTRPMLLGLIAIPLLIIAVYAHMAKPVWAFGADPVRLAPEREIGYTRFAMYLASQRVEEYRGRSGALPQSLTELDEAWPGMGYRVVSAGVYELSASGDSGRIIYQSDQPLPVLLGKSLRFLRGRE